MITIDAIGLPKADGQVEYIRAAIAAYAGCYYRGSGRNDSAGSNAQLLEYLKDGEPRRDLKTLSDENASVIADAWQREVERRMDDMTDNAAAGGAASKMKAAQIARAQSADGFKAASKVILRMLNERILQNLTADDSGALSAAPKVGEAYAKNRLRKYGVSTEQVYKATGQLMADMNEGNVGQIVLVPGTLK